MEFGIAHALFVAIEIVRLRAEEFSQFRLARRIGAKWRYHGLPPPGVLKPERLHFYVAHLSELTLLFPGVS